MFENIKNFFKKSEPAASSLPSWAAGATTTTEPPAAPVTPKKKREKKVKPQVELSDKEKATAAGEPWVGILKVDIDPTNINAGSFALDWNDKFLLNLIKSGYKQRDDDSDQIMVDRWFQTVCRNIALEIYEQNAADPKNREADDLRRVRARDIGNGRTEIS